jgi:GT2 family glycosyltransferase
MVSIIIVGWNCAEVLGACLESVFQHPPSTRFEVIYVDNASTDESVHLVQCDYPTVRVITNTRNRGFQRANNQGLALARGDELLLLNPDTRVLAGSLDALFRFLRQHPDAGAASPRCIHPDGRLQWTMGPFPSLPIVRHWFWHEHPAIARLFRRRPQDTDSQTDPVIRTQEQAYAYGACFAVKREVVDAVGPMDEGFFLAGGEVAWSREIQRRQWKVYYVAEATIVHWESVSRAQRSWIAELDWVFAHRRLLYLYDGVTAGIQGDMMFSAHLLLWAGGRCARMLGRASGAQEPAKRSPA